MKLNLLLSLYTVCCTGYDRFNLGLNFLEHIFFGINNQGERYLNKVGGHVHRLKITKLDEKKKIAAIFQHTF